MRLISLGFLFTLAACGAKNTDPSKLAAYRNPVVAERPMLMIANVENAFDGIDQGTEYPEFSSKTSNWSQHFALAKAGRVAEVFTAAHCPEIVVSSEVENQIAADMIADAAKPCQYKGYSANDDQKMPIGVAVFTSRAVSKVSKIESGYRPHLRVDFADGLSVIGVHLKSQRDGGEELRVNAANILKQVIANHSSGRLVIAGDFNVETDLLAGAQITNCSASAPPTHVFHGQWHRLDKIYSTSCGPVERLPAPFLMRGSQPYRSEYRKQGKMTEHSDEGYSDHIPLYMAN